MYFAYQSGFFEKKKRFLLIPNPFADNCKITGYMFDTHLKKQMLLPNIIYQDNHLFVVEKPAGMLVQGDKSGDKSLLDHVKSYIKMEFNKPGNVYLGLVHRLDRPVSGVIVLARTSKAASRLSEQFRQKKVKKVYWALVKGKIRDQGELKDFIQRMGVNSKISKKQNGKSAELSFRRLQYSHGLSLVEINLGTGRHHQIRIQLSNIGYPIIGDFRYGSKEVFPQKTLALHARSITIQHPVTKKIMTFSATLEKTWPKSFLQLSSNLV